MPATFIIIREDLQVDPVTIVAEGLLVGRVPTCELLLNHPSVSRLHAGITSVEGDYYIRNLRRGNPIMLNGAPFEEYEAFFFQAEDGIRALYVTGVQTCALPI